MGSLWSKEGPDFRLQRTSVVSAVTACSFLGSEEWVDSCTCWAQMEISERSCVAFRGFGFYPKGEEVDAEEVKMSLLGQQRSGLGIKVKYQGMRA